MEMTNLERAQSIKDTLLYGRSPITLDILKWLLPKGTNIYWADKKRTHVRLNFTKSMGRTGAALRYHLGQIMAGHTIRVVIG